MHKWAFIRLSEGDCHCDFLSTSFHQLLNLPGVQHMEQRWQNIRWSIQCLLLKQKKKSCITCSGLITWHYYVPGYVKTDYPFFTSLSLGTVVTFIFTVTRHISHTSLYRLSPQYNWLSATLHCWFSSHKHEALSIFSRKGSWWLINKFLSLMDPWP